MSQQSVDQRRVKTDSVDHLNQDLNGAALPSTAQSGVSTSEKNSLVLFLKAMGLGLDPDPEVLVPFFQRCVGRVGHVSWAQFKRCRPRAFKVGPARSLFNEGDRDGDGVVDASEFQQLWISFVASTGR